MAEAIVKNQAGKRYVCLVCGCEFIVTMASPAQTVPLSCDGESMTLKA